MRLRCRKVRLLLLREMWVLTMLEFHGMDPDLLQRVMTILVKRGKAQVFGQEDQQGVKFF